MTIDSIIKKSFINQKSGINNASKILNIGENIFFKINPGGKRGPFYVYYYKAMIKACIRKVPCNKSFFGYLLGIAKNHVKQRDNHSSHANDTETPAINLFVTSIP